MKKSFLVYGTGDFFYQYKSEIQEKFTICAYIDKNVKITNIDNTTVYHSLSEYSGQYDVILVMTESPFVLFEILDIIKMNGVSAKKVSLGISFYGSLSKYFDFFYAMITEFKLLVKIALVMRRIRAYLYGICKHAWKTFAYPWGDAKGFPGKPL